VRELIIDGYNVIHAVPRYAALLEHDPAGARDRLVNDVASFAAGAWKAVVVFDGAGGSGFEPEADTTEVRVVYSPAGSDADTIVEALARDVRERGADAVVVTSDATTQWTVLGPGILRMSAREFADEMTGDLAESRELMRSGSANSTIDMRIDADVRSSLLNLRDRRE
jgi:predicted RNA-binding protein with PIN domain